MGAILLWAVADYDVLTYLMVLALHVTGIAMWAGGNLFLHVVFNPILKMIPPQPATLLANRTGLRYTYYTWAALVLIVSTGLFLTWKSGWLNVGVLMNTTSGNAILALMVLTLLGIVNGLVITFYLIPRTTAGQVGTSKRLRTIEEITAAVRGISILSLANTAIALASIALGVAVRVGI